jgi:hypothetical protein
MTQDRQQAKVLLTDGDLTHTNILETDMVSGQGKDLKTFTVLSVAVGGTVTLQFSFDRLEWFNHPSAQNPAAIVAGTPVTITVSDLMPFYRLRIVINAPGLTGRVRAWYVAN